MVLCLVITPTGCPLPASPEARKACTDGDSSPFLRCTNGNDCPGLRQCCRNSHCGGICMEITTNNIFH